MTRPSHFDQLSNRDSQDIRRVMKIARAGAIANRLNVHCRKLREGAVERAKQGRTLTLDFELRHVSPEYGGVVVILVAGGENAELARTLLRREGYSAA